MSPNGKPKVMIRSKNPENNPNAPETKEFKDDNVIHLLGVTISAINATKDLVPIDLAKGILGTIANILTIAQSVIKNQSDFQAIVEKCETIREILERATKDATNNDLRGYLGHALSQLNKSVNRINSEVASKKEQGFWHKLISVTIDRDRIAGWEKDLDRVLLLFNTEGIAGIASRVEKLALGLESSINISSVIKYRPTETPSRPAMMYGRDDLVAELTNLVVNDEHIALIGPGGMGKSSLAKAILNEPLVTEKFADRRFFVTYDGLDPSAITFQTFMTRFAGALGIELSSADPVRQISTFLRFASALVVLDNAETFEEASASSALVDIPPAIAEIAGIPGVILILTSRSRRNAPNVLWTTKDIPPLDLNSAQAVFFRIYRRASRSDAGVEVKDLLKELDFHPLSINLLANTAQQNDWSPATLLKRWNNRHSAVLDPGKGKLQSLSDTMQLSLSSPSIQDLGDDGRRALAIIAFLPQGLNDDLASDLLPSLQQVDAICDVLCMQSLVYRQDKFIKMLAPIRHYMRDSLPPPDSTCMREIRTFYHYTLDCCSDKRDQYTDIIMSDHLNIEHVVALDLAHGPDDTEKIYAICGKFLWCLTIHLPRPTTLTPTIFNIVENSSTWTPKAHCLWHLGCLYSAVSQLTEGMKAFKAAGALYLTTGAYRLAVDCVFECAETYRCQGRFIQLRQVLEDFQHSDSWKYLDETAKAEAWHHLKSMDDRFIGLESKTWHRGAKMYYGGDIVQVKAHLEDILLQCTHTEVFCSCNSALRLLAEGALCEGRLSDAMDILQKNIDMTGGPLSALWYGTWKGVVASRQGDYDLAREFIRKASGLLECWELRNTYEFLHRSYGSARIELAAGEYDIAESHFTATVEGCDMQDHLLYKAFSIRGLGEIAFARGNFALAAERFAETQSLCIEMGIPPGKIYSCFPFSVLLENFEGWASFLEGRSPFTNVT
ncbi:hypothetical protein DEU56DRAFT_534411 [Suillus clintonianus]|uniref:uncharacterized protein n=1 Tax=Suillus clintonianus TaxID=1904413 RepID=UPI001B875DE1|nr:uncharacterized protein DEU56DRAFT_534411 [Suillus clintonianus]KAG2126922.1 hypothetical protein DEU56DRAFT_534411 [Suillus clintonianus]